MEYKYHTIPIISPRAYIWSKGLFAKFLFFLGGEGGAYTWTYICVLKTLHLVQAIVIFVIFCSQPVFITDFFKNFFKSSVIRTVNMNYRSHTVLLLVSKVPVLSKLNIMFKFNYSKYNPQGLFSGGLIHGRSFLFQKLVPKRPGAYTGGAYLIGILRYKTNMAR